MVIWYRISNLSISQYAYLSGLSPKVIPENPANGMTTRKRKEREVAAWNKSTWGFSWATTQPVSTSITAEAFELGSARPHYISLSKALQAACPMHDTQGAGVVTETNNSIVVAQKPPRCSIKPVTGKLFGERPAIYIRWQYRIKNIYFFTTNNA